MSNSTLVFIPTYNEKDNVEPLFKLLSDLPLKFDILFLDDNSPDGTGKIMDRLACKNPHVHVIHRKGKEGIGSAHKEGLRWAYRRGYQHFISMDADFTHPPEYIPKLLDNGNGAAIVVGSRHLMKESLKGWNLMRKALTKLGHLLTTQILGLKYDSTGAFRLYRLEQIPEEFLNLIQSNGYSFFFESLYTFHRRGIAIAEIPITLPPRTHGSSKMSYAEIFKSLRLLLQLYCRPL